MKVPELYITASNILKSHTEKRISLKSLIYNSNFQNIRQLYALLHEVIKSSGKIDHVLAAGIVHITEKEKYLARFFLYDIVLKGRRVASSHPLVKSIAKSRKELTEKLKECNERKISDLGKVPRYARVNTLKAEVREVIEILKSEGWILKDKIISYEGFLDVVRGLSEDEFIVDFHLEYLLVFHSNTDFHDHELVKTGVILLQDKASCLSAVALNPKRGSQVIDACAAPGMKTTLLAALMENEGRIVAVDRSKERSQCLSKFVESTGSSCVEIVAMDFLKIQPNEYPDIKYILVDPSCSGSGIARRLGNEYGLEEKRDRLRKLSNFQSQILKHAFSFPNVKRVVYSTCSLHKEENELVVEDVLESVGDSFKVKATLKDWPTRGSEEFSFGCKCARASVESDLTNGFFICCFVRKKLNLK
ncbi:28S rRNA (cytosine-C(5))-methyltransferase-like isoform X1 [Artemia franciscana]|uniref:SAM-dependent MTase RsmB/NOP-type domain-containing protein n=1 Tax=Artemia franciscana TaxID=6661 RepID=A0AA88HYX0_ARTSF|nr:hypothetical protein QYM36_006994 [Artemia franciscana]